MTSSSSREMSNALRSTRGHRRLRFCTVRAFVLISALVASSSLGCDSSPGGDTTSVADVDPFEMNQRLGRGVNFGNALEAPNEGEWGVTLAALHFQRAQEAGFQSIRLPVKWSNHALAEAPFTINSGFMARVNWAVEQALSRDMNVVLNVHHYDEMASNPQAHRERWVALWRQIAERFKDHSENLIFELLNEPHGALNATLWNSMVADGLREIRKSNPNRNVVIGPVSWNSTTALPGLQIPDDDHVIVTVHFYEPFQFTHQGAGWVGGADAWLGTTWMGTDAQKTFVTNILQQAANWGQSNGRPIYVGEFGAFSRADIDSRARWTSYVAREAERLGMSWAYWEFMSGFGLYNIELDLWLNPLKEALLPTDTTMD